MNVLVYQSHAARAPAWLRRCTAGVREWTAQSGFDYRLLGDELFKGIPIALSLKAQSRLPLTDLGRLLWAERLLRQWDCVIWIDADVLIFDAPRLRIDTTAPYLVCREVLVKQEEGAAPAALIAYSPTVLMFRRDEPFLARWIARVKKLAAQRPGFHDAEFGRELLREMARREELPAIANVGHFNAKILKEIHGSAGPAIEAMMKASGAPFAAGNLCGHYSLPDAVYQRIIDRLLATSGGVVNDHLANIEGADAARSLPRA